MSRNSNQLYDTIHDDQQATNIHGLMSIIRQKRHAIWSITIGSNKRETIRETKEVWRMEC